MLSGIVPQIPVNRVLWHMETVDRLNAMAKIIHHMETFFRLQLPAHRRQNWSLSTVRKHGSLSCRLADHFSMGFVIVKGQKCKAMG